MLLASIHLETGNKGGVLKRFFTLTTVVCLILGFQNCSQNGLQSNDLSSGDVAISFAPSPNSGASGTTAKVTYIEVPNIENQISSQKITDSSSALSAQRLVVSTQTGAIELVDDSNTVLQQRCLGASDLEELKTILSGSNICSAAAKSAEQICGMSYKAAYASLYANEQRVKLGEELDTCGTGKKDLCGSLAEVFQAYISHLRLHWQEMNCAQ